MSTMLTYWREIGIGISAGTDNNQSQTWDSLYTHSMSIKLPRRSWRTSAHADLSG
jgi:hypothetical protein